MQGEQVTEVVLLLKPNNALLHFTIMQKVIEETHRSFSSEDLITRVA